VGNGSSARKGAVSIPMDREAADVGARVAPHRRSAHRLFTQLIGPDSGYELGVADRADGRQS